jgi:hypothetical protein
VADGRSFVWHFVLVRRGRKPASGERLASFVLAPEDAHRIGLEKLRRAVEAERREWSRRAIAGGYVDDWSVVTVHERGFTRSLFPAAALPGLDARPRLVSSKGGPL